MTNRKKYKKVLAETESSFGSLTEGHKNVIYKVVKADKSKQLLVMREEHYKEEMQKIIGDKKYLGHRMKGVIKVYKEDLPMRQIVDGTNLRNI